MNNHNEKIWNIISNAKTGMLVTQDSNTKMHSRPMHVVQEDYDGTLWFFTQYNSKKVKSAVSDQVCVTFCDHKNGSHLSITGESSVTQDRQQIDKLWSSAVETWFPEGKDSDEVALLRVDVQFGEYWVNSKTSVGTVFEIAKSKIQEKRPNLGENQKFNH